MQKQLAECGSQNAPYIWWRKELPTEVTNWCSVQAGLSPEKISDSDCVRYLTLIWRHFFWRQFRVAFSPINSPLSLTTRLGPYAGLWILHQLNFEGVGGYCVYLTNSTCKGPLSDCRSLHMCCSMTRLLLQGSHCPWLGSPLQPLQGSLQNILGHAQSFPSPHLWPLNKGSHCHSIDCRGSCSHIQTWRIEFVLCWFNGRGEMMRGL